MAPVTIFKFLHIASMFTAVAISFGPAVLLRFSARGGNVRSIQGVAETTVRLARFIGPVFVLGVVFGLITAFLGGFNFLAPWLLIAYVLFVAGVIVGAGGEGPYTARVAAAAAANPGDTPGPELTAVLSSPRAGQLFWLFALLVAAIIFDMVIKPFS
jgi:hypothetical protein